MNCRWNRTREKGRWRKRPKKKTERKNKKELVRTRERKADRFFLNSYRSASLSLSTIHPSILPDNIARFLRIPGTIHIHIYAHHAPSIYWCHNACPSSVGCDCQPKLEHTQVQQQIDWSLPPTLLTGKFISAFRLYLPTESLKKMCFQKTVTGWRKELQIRSIDQLQCHMYIISGQGSTRSCIEFIILIPKTIFAATISYVRELERHGGMTSLKFQMFHNGNHGDRKFI